MKKPKINTEELGEKLSLPEEILLNSPKLTLTAGRKALVENHRGILEYGKERMVIAAKRGRLSINGTELHLVAMNREELLIGGRIHSVEWE